MNVREALERQLGALLLNNIEYQCKAVEMAAELEALKKALQEASGEKEATDGPSADSQS